jgi:hypothetical protein
MGVTSYLKGKAKEAITNAKAERAYNIERKLENRNQYDKGYREGQYKRGLAEGSGQVVPAAKQQGPALKMAGVAGRSPAKSSGDIFGNFGGGIGGGIGLGLGFGEEQRPHAPPPMRTTQISKSGKVTIQEPYERKVQPQREDPLAFWGTSGAAGSTKKEKHPYDIF